MIKFKKFTEITEAVKHINNVILSLSDIEEYLKAVKKQIPEQIADIIYLTIKYKLISQKDIDDIRTANKGQLDKLSFKYNTSLNEMIEIWESLKSLKSNLRLLPQYQTISERKAFMAGNLKMSDITIDLDSSSGRNACAKQYMPMVHKIVNQFVGQSKLSKPELMSAALQGFTDAMNDWRKDGKEDNSVPFKTYAAYRIKQQILNDINTYSYTVTTNWYGVQKMGSNVLNAISLDGLSKDDDGEFKQDRLRFIGEEPNYNLTKSEEQNWSELYKLIENNFKQRDIDIFYRYFGLKGYSKEKGKDIAKSLGVSPQMITAVTKYILKQLKSNKKAMELLVDLQSSYNESLMFDIMNLDKNMMVESILNDDMFILLEELTKWSNKNIYINTIEKTLELLDKSESKVINDLLTNDFDYLDKNFKSNKKIIIKFLSLLYPTESFTRKSDVSLLEYIDELSELYKKYNK